MVRQCSQVFWAVLVHDMKALYVIWEEGAFKTSPTLFIVEHIHFPQSQFVHAILLWTWAHSKPLWDVLISTFLQYKCAREHQHSVTKLLPFLTQYENTPSKNASRYFATPPLTPASNTPFKFMVIAFVSWVGSNSQVSTILERCLDLSARLLMAVCSGVYFMSCVLITGTRLRLQGTLSAAKTNTFVTHKFRNSFSPLHTKPKSTTTTHCRNAHATTHFFSFIFSWYV